MGNKLAEFLGVSVVAFYMGLMWLGAISYIVGPLIIYFYPKSAAWIVPYVLWMAYDIYTGCTIDRKWNRLGRILFWMKTGRDYFPARLIKTADLPEGKSYILAAHPHATMPVGLVINFFTEVNNVGKLFPGIDFRGAVRTLFYVPLFRELLVCMGGVLSSEFNIARLLQRNTSTGIVITPGGAREIPLCNPGSNECTIYASKRKGFVRIALKTGSALVPVVSFGDTELFGRMRTPATKLLNFIPAIRSGCPDGYRPVSLIPKRFPLNTIVGEPITVPKVENPSSELIDQYHAQFYDAYRQLFEKYKHDYSPGGSSYKLVII